MSSLVQIRIHESQFPENIRRDLKNSFRLRRINHKFHYDSVKQAQRWLELHKAYSPVVTDPDCARVYERAFEAAAARLQHGSVHLIGLGCGGGQKDARLLSKLADSQSDLFYTPMDVSSAMVLIAHKAASKVIPEHNCFPLVCDLVTTDQMQSILASHSFPDAPRLISFFGMLPNFEPQTILPKLAELIRPGEYLLLSANLAPGPDYLEGVKRVLPLYDNALTREWLITLLLDSGFERCDGRIAFGVESAPADTVLKRIVAGFQLERNRKIEIDSENFSFSAGESVRLFFSYRHTPSLVESLLAANDLIVLDQWITSSQEEGVFLATRKLP